LSENNKETSSSSVERSDKLTRDEKIKLYELAVAYQSLLRLYPFNIFSYIFPPVLLVVSVVAIFLAFRTSNRLYGVLAAYFISPLVFLPFIGLAVIWIILKNAGKRLETSGFDITMDKTSLEPMLAWLEKEIELASN